MLVVCVHLLTVDLQYAKGCAGQGFNDDIDRRNDMMVSVESGRLVAIGLLQMTHYHWLFGYECPALRGTFISLRYDFANDTQRAIRSPPRPAGHSQPTGSGTLCNAERPGTRRISVRPDSGFLPNQFLEGKGSKRRKGRLLPQEAVNVSGHDGRVPCGPLVARLGTTEPGRYSKSGALSKKLLRPGISYVPLAQKRISSKRRTMKILVVDDERMLADLLEATLLDQGHEICGVTTNVAEAVDLVRLHRPDIAVLDMRLKGTELGSDIAHQLAEAGDLRDLGILYVTGGVDFLHQHAGIGHAGLQKPYSAATLASACRLFETLCAGVPYPVRCHMECTFLSCPKRHKRHSSLSPFAIRVSQVSSAPVQARFSDLFLVRDGSQKIFDLFCLECAEGTSKRAIDLTGLFQRMNPVQKVSSR